MEKKKKARAVQEAGRETSGLAGHKLSRFARGLLAEWKRLGLPTMTERVVVAVSGGADSTALLLALEELLRAKRLDFAVTVAHLDHGLRGEDGAADALWVTTLAGRLCFETEIGRVAVAERAGERQDNLEQAARRARYGFLAGAALKWRAQVLLVAHTMDDQAETVLLNLMRGSGAEGLSGIEPVRKLDQESEVRLIRPLLRWARRSLTEEYCRQRGVEARVDEMNLDERFARVRVRRSLLPLMRSFNGRVVEALSRTSELLREDAAMLAVLAESLLDEASNVAKGETSAGAAGEAETRPSLVLDRTGPGMQEESQASEALQPSEALQASEVRPLRVDVLKGAPAGLRRRALREWIKRGKGDTRRLELVHLSGVERLLEGEQGGRVAQLPGGARVYRKRGWLYLYVK